MLYHLMPGLSDINFVFNVFRYITFRAAGAVVTALVVAFVLGPIVIKRLQGANTVSYTHLTLPTILRV